MATFIAITEICCIKKLVTFPPLCAHKSTGQKGKLLKAPLQQI